MIKPFQIVWELIEFGLQALFLYVLAIIIFIGILVIVIKDNKPQQLQVIKYIKVGQGSLSEGRECTRIDGCRVLKDGTIEW